LKPTDGYSVSHTARKIYLGRLDIKPEIAEFWIPANQNREKSKVVRRISVTIDDSAAFLELLGMRRQATFI
jgi:hypothetical protein